MVCQPWTAAQRRTGPPAFEPGDTEGLVVSPNPAIRYAWKRKVFWKSTVQPPRQASRAVPCESGDLKRTTSARHETIGG